MRLFMIFILSTIGAHLHGQKIDNTVSFRELLSDRYIRVNYDNDLFAGQDENYTQGYSIELVSSAFSKNPINQLFFRLNNDNARAGIVFEHLGYTPDHYEKMEVQLGDRPFAGVAMLRSFIISTNEKSKQRLTSHFSVGIMGPYAKAKEIQTSIHEITGSLKPQGWKNQIANQLVISYAIDYEMELVRINDFLGLNANASADIGNLYTNVALGINTTFGLINNPYRSNNDRKFLLYGYIQPIITAVGYDGTLQGALFSDDSLYTISAGDVNRIVGQVNYGIILQTKYIYLEYSISTISKEIKSLTSASWGGIRLGIRI